MDHSLYAPIRQRELLAEAEHRRLGRIAARARSFADMCRPSQARRLLAALTRRPAMTAC